MNFFKRIAVVCVALIAVCFAGCSLFGGDNGKGAKSSGDFVGSYTSIYENGIENADTSFDLEIKKDKTFTLKGNGRDFSGVWKSKTVNGEVQVICFPIVEEKVTKCEFTLTMLNDGTVMAKSEVLEDPFNGISVGKTYNFSAFGRSKIDDITYYYITTVIFEKK